MNKLELAKLLGFENEKELDKNSIVSNSNKNDYLTLSKDQVYVWDKETYSIKQVDFYRNFDNSYVEYFNDLKEQKLFDYFKKMGFNYNFDILENTLTYNKEHIIKENDDHTKIEYKREQNITLLPNGSLIQWDNENFEPKEVEINNVHELKNFLREPDWPGLYNLSLNNFLDQYGQRNISKELGFVDYNELMKHTINPSKDEINYLTDCGNKVVEWKDNDFQVINAIDKDKLDLNLQKKFEELESNHLKNLETDIEKDPFDLKVIMDTFDKTKEPDFGMSR